MSTENKIYANALNSVVELGPASLNRLSRHFGDYKSAWQAVETKLKRAGLDERKIEAVRSARGKVDPERLWEDLQKQKIEVILLDEKSYPRLLAEIPSPPPILYVRGDPSALNQNAVAIVGSRKMTIYGKRSTEEITAQLTHAGLTIVSGLAFGVDATAQQTALSAGGSAVAVLASPIDNHGISPKANYLLAQKIIQQGCLVSEYPPGVAVQKQNFPIRNRIIAGLSLGTLVVEADEESGGLITAQYALDFNREVFAIPGPIFSEVSRGTNKLIQRGAKLVLSAADILEELSLDATLELKEEIFTASEEELGVLGILNHEPMHIDDLVRKIKGNAGQINAVLTMLEMKGRVKNVGGSQYVKIR